jgi:uncharacterized protein YaaQ
MICGGFSNEKKVDEECKSIIENVRKELQHEVEEIISYKTQVVNGVNYLIKIKVNNPKFYFVKVHKCLNNEYKILEHSLKHNF